MLSITSRFFGENSDCYALAYEVTHMPGLENSTRPLVFTSDSGCRASGNFDISSENKSLSHICQYFL